MDYIFQQASRARTCTALRMRMRLVLRAARARVNMRFGVVAAFKIMNCCTFSVVAPLQRDGGLFPQ